MMKMRSNAMRILIVIWLAALTHLVAKVDPCSCRKESNQVMSISFSPSLPSLPSLMHCLVPLHHNSSGFLFLSSAMAGCKLLRYVCLFLLGYVGAVTAACEKINDCSCRMSDDKVLNLEPLDKTSRPSFTGMKDTDDKPNVYSWNPCTKFKEGNNCEDALLCQETPSGDYYTVAKEVSSFDENSDGSINITYTPCTVPSQKDFIREAIIVFMCDHSEDRGKFSQFHEHKIIPNQKSLYTATFSTKYACFESGGRGGLSTGSILLIVFFPLVLIYFIAGLLYNKIHKGVSSFPEMIPNHSFWGDVPFLVKDGCVFTFQGMAGCCKRVSMKVKGDSYAEI